MALTIKAANARLRKLAQFLYKIPPEKWNFNKIVSRHENDCGTVCCAIGWCPAVFPREWEYRHYWDTMVAMLRNNHRTPQPNQSFQDAEKFFLLSEDECDNLFHPDDYDEYIVTAEMVADKIMAFVDSRR